MKVQPPLLGKGFKKVRYVFRRQLADQVALESQVDARVRAPTEIKGNKDQRLVHRDHRMTEASDTTPLAEGLVQRLPKHKSNILDEMMRVPLDVARGLNGEVKQTVPGELLQHVVKHADAGADLVAPPTVQVDLQRDPGLAGLTVYRALAVN